MHFLWLFVLGLVALAFAAALWLIDLWSVHSTLVKAAVVVVTTVVVLLIAVASHFAMIELGNEVAVLKTTQPDGSFRYTRLWIVDEPIDTSATPARRPIAWLHSGGAAWQAQFRGHPVVAVCRAERWHRYRATPMPGPHPHVHELLRAKYGWADRWVRLIGPDNASTLAVRLEPVDDAISAQPC